MNSKNNSKLSSYLIIAVATIVVIVSGSANTNFTSFAQETTGQITKGTIVQGDVTAANLTNG